MSGIDKAIIKDKLELSGWVDVAGEGDEPKMVPPESLWNNKPEYFSIYEARDIDIDLAPKLELK